ncbi:MAG: cytotoxic translational repressor of toxin-antitoxin stability system [Phycisphaerales bacterium]|jgi:mRNA interferase RelE/StbE|nr:cytotoxic translational repressor of toxin-antitoxin stability system [Phycisphaerales bacterium]
MRYEVEFRPSALRDIAGLSRDVAGRIIEKIEAMRVDLAGDVKRLKQFVPRYRLRVGDWRVLFEIDQSRVVIWRVRHRREVYDR